MGVATLRRHGDQVGVTFAAETLARLGFEEGQQLTLVELADGVRLVKRDPVLERRLELARKVPREQADVLRELAAR